MVGRFIVHGGDSDRNASVWDNAANGTRDTGLAPQVAYRAAADLELQYDAHGYRDPDTVRRVDPPVPVDAYMPAGILDHWLYESGKWVGRVRRPDGTFVFLPQTELRPTGEG